MQFQLQPPPALLDMAPLQDTPAPPVDRLPHPAGMPEQDGVPVQVFVDAGDDEGWDDDDKWDDDGHYGNCGMMSDGTCSKVGSEECDWMCGLRDV